MKKLLVVLLYLFSAGIASAHATGTSFEKIVGDGAYKVDVGYDPSQLQAGERAVFDFNIKKLPGQEQVQYDHVWVRIVHGTDTLLATGVAKMPFGPTTLLYVIPSTVTGDLTVNIRFEKGDTAIAETDFTLPVSPPANSGNVSFSLLLAGIAGLCVGAGAMFVLKKMRG